jgi:hypothetical protein
LPAVAAVVKMAQAAAVQVATLTLRPVKLPAADKAHEIN